MKATWAFLRTNVKVHLQLKLRRLQASFSHTYFPLNGKQKNTRTFVLMWRCAATARRTRCRHTHSAIKTALGSVGLCELLLSHTAKVSGTVCITHLSQLWETRRVFKTLRIYLIWNCDNATKCCSEVEPLFKQLPFRGCGTTTLAMSPSILHLTRQHNKTLSSVKFNFDLYDCEMCKS